MTRSTSVSAGLDPQAKRALLTELLQSRLESSRVVLPLTHGQQAMWFLHQLAPESSAYNVAFSGHIRSAVNTDALRRSLQTLIERHAALRTTYMSQDGALVQVIHPWQSLAFDLVDASGWDDELLDRRIIEQHRRPFDLENGPMFRATFFTRSATDHVLLLGAHHITIDGRSVWTLLEDLGTLYMAEVSQVPANLPPPASQFAEYVQWQNALIAGEQGNHLWDYWQAELGGELPVLDLPTDRPRPAAQTLTGSTLLFELGEHLSSRVRDFARQERTTPFMILLATYQTLLHRHSGQDDILVGTPAEGRGKPSFARLVGDCINMVVLRARFEPGMTFRELLAHSRAKVVGALEHQDFPFPLLVERLAPKADPSRSPIFQAGINLFQAQRGSPMQALFAPDKTNAHVDLGGLIVEQYMMWQQEGQLDLMLQFVDAGGEFYPKLQYNTDLFDASTIQRLGEHYRTLLESMLDQPDFPIDALPMLTTDETEQITRRWNATDEPCPAHLTLPEIIEMQVDRAPGEVAIRFGDSALEYRQMDHEANRLANYLRHVGIGAGDVVGVNLERSPDLLVTLLGVLKAGAAYLPFDPSYPASRQEFVLTDSRAVAVLTTTELAPHETPNQVRVLCLDKLRSEIRQQPTDRPDLGTPPDDLAYLIYTSGSTGQPKGVRVPHRAIVNLLSSMQRRPGVTSDDVLVAVTTVAFDIAALELFLPLTVGAQVVIASREAAQSGPALLALIYKSHATMIQATPVTFRLLLQAGLGQSRVPRCLCGGEAMPPDLAAALLAAGAELWNMYGPTETTVWSTVQRVEQEDSVVPVGRPIGNTQVYVLNPAMQPTPIGVVGELYIGGAGVSDGYHGRPDLTAERFVPDPFSVRSGTRLYRTGDLARFRHDGTLVVLGRVDHQVKLRGYRIEPGEIEATLTDQPDVREAIVTIRPDRQGSFALIAYLTTHSGNRINPGTLRTALRNRLPEYMVPSAFVFLNELPLTPNGKVDRTALPDPHGRRTEDNIAFVAPTTETEQVLAEIWTRILSVPRVSTLDTFFDLGGHSLQAIEAIAATEQSLGVRPNPGLFQTQTLGQYAATCDALIAQRERSEPPARQQPLTGRTDVLRRWFGARVRQNTP